MADWFNREDLARELAIGFGLAAMVAGGLAWFGEARDDARQRQAQEFEDTRQNQAEVLENTRFVRTAAMAEPGTLRPFAAMNLAGAQLSGLPLGCPEGAQPRDTAAGCVDLLGADLTEADLLGATLAGADMRFAYLTDANLTGANLTGANLTGADMTGANMTGANMTGADLTGANLRGTDLRYATLTGAGWEGLILDGACYDEDTVWPAGYEPPTRECRRFILRTGHAVWP